MPDFGGTRALLVGGAIAAMKITDTVHPPVGTCCHLSWCCLASDDGEGYVGAKGTLRGAGIRVKGFGLGS